MILQAPFYFIRILRELYSDKTPEYKPAYHFRSYI